MTLSSEIIGVQTLSAGGERVEAPAEVFCDRNNALASSRRVGRRVSTPCADRDAMLVDGINTRTVEHRFNGYAGGGFDAVSASRESAPVELWGKEI